jgi:CRISPR system Cascade subunit CasC
MKIEVHLIQNFAPSSLNRDAANIPKDCIFGGVRRARISSQCFKRAMRLHFPQSGVPTAARTKLLQGALIDTVSCSDLADDVRTGINSHLDKLRDEPNFAAAVKLFIEKYYTASDKKAPEKTNVLLFLSNGEFLAIAESIASEWQSLNDALEKTALEKAKAKEKAAKEKAKVKAAVDEDSDTADEGNDTTEDDDDASKAKASSYAVNKKITEKLEETAKSVDIALFGRMLASDASAKLKYQVDGACQVAQAISTHRADLETDFYSAADDLQTDRPDAGMLGITGFNSACFYRYALLDFNELQKNLQGDQAAARQAVEAFLRAAVEAIPTGKQNSMAAQNPPSFGFFVVRDKGMPLSLANAFVSPVDASEDKNGYTNAGEPLGLVQASINRLDQFWKKLTGVYGEKGITAKATFCTEGFQLQTLPACDGKTLDDTIDAVINALPTTSSDGGAA